MGERVELWGFPGEDVDGARASVERALGVTFRLFESAEIGPYLFAELGDAAELTLRPNLDPDFDPGTDDEEEALAEPEFEAYGVLLYVDFRREDAAAREKLELLNGEAQLLAVEEDEG